MGYARACLTATFMGTTFVRSFFFLLLDMQRCRRRCRLLLLLGRAGDLDNQTRARPFARSGFLRWRRIHSLAAAAVAVERQAQMKKLDRDEGKYAFVASLSFVRPFVRR